MTELLFMTILFLGLGFIAGKFFKNLNPILVFIGFIFVVSMAPLMIEQDNNYYTACVVIGAMLNFKRPVSAIVAYIRNFFSTISLKRLNAGYSKNIDQQKQQAEENLYSQKRDVEAELKRQKYEAEQDIARQRREAEEAIKRQAEELRREQEKYQKNKHNSQHNNQRSQSSTNNKNHLNPLVFADACEIVGLSQGKTFKDYKRAYLQLMKLYHSDKLTGLSDELRKQEEEKAKALNVAMNTIKKKLK